MRRSRFGSRSSRRRRSFRRSRPNEGTTRRARRLRCARSYGQPARSGRRFPSSTCSTSFRTASLPYPAPTPATASVRRALGQNRAAARVPRRTSPHVFPSGALPARLLPDARRAVDARAHGGTHRHPWHLGSASARGESARSLGSRNASRPSKRTKLEGVVARLDERGGRLHFSSGSAVSSSPRAASRAPSRGRSADCVANVERRAADDRRALGRSEAR